MQSYLFDEFCNNKNISIFIEDDTVQQLMDMCFQRFLLKAQRKPTQIYRLSFLEVQQTLAETKVL